MSIYGVSLERLSTPINTALLGERFQRDASDMLARLGPLYLQTMPDLIVQLYAAQHARNRDQLWHVAHTLKGNASAISAESLEGLVVGLEARAFSLAWRQVQQIVEQISAENDRVITWLQNTL